MSESEIVVEIQDQIFPYLELCAHYETKPSVLGFSKHLAESYSDN